MSSKILLTTEQKITNRRASSIRWKLKHPIKTRNINKLNSRLFREKNKEQQKEYHSNYFKRWLQNPVNENSHRARNIVGYLKSYYIKRGIVSPTYSQVWENIHKVGWDIITKSMVINHKISLKLIYSLNINVPIDVVFDISNIELIDKDLNNSVAKRRITRDTIRLARKLEKKFECLKGLEDLVKSYKGKVI
jgi:hypothetical protein